MTHTAEKLAAARAALSYVSPGAVIGVGTGTTAAAFIEALAESDIMPSAAVVTSADTRARLEHAGVRVVALGDIDELSVYIDGADEIDAAGRMIKGAGGALTMEKIVATAARRFVCIADESKVVERLGDRARLPLEVLAPALRTVGEMVEALGGVCEVRAGYLTDLGNPIIDVSGLDFSDPLWLERQLDVIPGVVECGLFAARRADVAFIGFAGGDVRAIDFSAQEPRG